jgi:tetratricopeptide (TPR) repeat protein
MSNRKSTVDLPEFLKNITAPILGFMGLTSTINSFFKLFIEKDSGLFVFIFLVAGVLCLESIFYYYAYRWEPKSQNAISPLILRLDLTKEKSKVKTERRQKTIRKFSATGLWLNPVLVIAILGGWQYVESLPPKNITILVAEFDGPNSRNDRLAATIRANLRKETIGYSNIEIKATEIIKEEDGSKKAREEGKKKKATIVIWGWYEKKEDFPISAHFELLNWPRFSSVAGDSFISINLSGWPNLLPKLADVSSNSSGSKNLLSLPVDLTNNQVLYLPTHRLEKNFIIQVRKDLPKEMTYLTLLTLGVSHTFAEEWEDAIERFTRALKQIQNVENRFSDLTNKAIALNFRANALRSQGNVRGALIDANEAIRIEPNRASAYTTRSLARVHLRDEKGALADINSAIKLEPQASQHYLSRGIIRGIFQDAEGIKDIDKFIQQNPKEANGYAARGTIRIKRGDVPRGLKDFDKAIEFNSENPILYLQRGSYRCDIGDIDRGMTDLDEAIELNPKSSNAYSMRGMLRIKFGDKKEGIADLDKAIQLNPKSSDVYVQRGSYKIEFGDNKGGIADLDEAIRINSMDDIAYALRGSYRLKFGDIKGGITDFNQAIQLNPRNSNTYVSRGSSYIQIGNKKEGVEDLNKAILLSSQNIQRNPANAFAYFTRGMAYYQLDQDKDVISNFSKAIQLDRKDYVTFLLRGITYSSLKNFQGAISDFNQAIQLKPDSFEAYFGRGLAYQYQKNYRQAFSDYDHALRLRTNFIETISKIEILKNMGIINYEVGSKDEALRLFEIIREDKEGRNHLSSNFALAVALNAKGQKQKSFELAKSVLSSDKDYSSIDFLKKKQLWGNRFINDAQKFLSRSDIKALM